VLLSNFILTTSILRTLKYNLEASSDFKQLISNNARLVKTLEFHVRIGSDILTSALPYVFKGSVFTNIQQIVFQQGGIFNKYFDFISFLNNTARVLYLQKLERASPPPVNKGILRDPTLGHKCSEDYFSVCFKFKITITDVRIDRLKYLNMDPVTLVHRLQQFSGLTNLSITHTLDSDLTVLGVFAIIKYCPFIVYFEFIWHAAFPAAPSFILSNDSNDTINLMDAPTA
jgi:hypothetical protein